MGKNASPRQIAEIVRMLADGEYSGEFAQTIIERRVQPVKIKMVFEATVTLTREQIAYPGPSYAELSAMKMFSGVLPEHEFNNLMLSPAISSTGNFISGDKNEYELVLVKLLEDPGCLSKWRFLSMLDALGLRPAVYAELVAFLKQYRPSAEVLKERDFSFIYAAGSLGQSNQRELLGGPNYSPMGIYRDTPDELSDKSGWALFIEDEFSDYPVDAGERYLMVRDTYGFD